MLEDRVAIEEVELGVAARAGRPVVRAVRARDGALEAERGVALDERELDPEAEVPQRQLPRQVEQVRALRLGPDRPCLRSPDGTVWKLVDAGALFYLVRPGRPPLPLRASAPGELFT